MKQLTRPKRPSSRLNDDHREARRIAIIDAAESIFAAKPFNKVSMRDIAREAGISPALIYRHFPDQQHLFVEAFLRGANRLMEIFDQVLNGEKEVFIDEAAKKFITYLTEHEQYFKMMTHFMLEGSLNEGLRDKLNAIERSMLDKFDQVFEMAGMRGNPRALSHAFFAALNGVLITFRQHPGRSAEEVKAHMDAIGGIISSLFTDAIKRGITD